MANYCLHSEATAFLCSNDGNRYQDDCCVNTTADDDFFSRLIIGGLDGSVTFLVIAHNSSAEQLEETRAMLKKLPARKLQGQPKNNLACDAEEDPGNFYSDSLTEELNRRRLQKQVTLRRFRFILYSLGYY